MAKAELSVLLQALSGKAGNVVFTKAKDGTHVRPHIKGTNPNTPAQQLIRENFTKASGIYRTFNTSQLQAWKNYAQFQTVSDALDGSKSKPTAFNAFMKLACKFLQVDPDGTVPTTPPTTGFNGDNVDLTVTGGTGELTFTASAANASGVTTEILLQPLANANRKPQSGAYRHKLFHVFTTGNLSLDVTVPVGYYAAGYRFVKTATGQASTLQTLAVQGVTLAIESGGANTKISKKAA